MAKIKSMNRVQPKVEAKEQSKAPKQAADKQPTPGKQPTPAGKQPTDICPINTLTRGEIAYLMQGAQSCPWADVNGIIAKLAEALQK